MPFKPKMQAMVKSVVPLTNSSSLLLDRMAIDYWCVAVGEGAAGRYVSPDPRFVIFLKGGSMSLGEVGGRRPSLCSVCFVPANLPLVGMLGTPGCLEHLDIHIDASHLSDALGPGFDLGSPLFLPDSVDLRQIAMMLTKECRGPRRQCGFSEALAFAAIHEVFAIDAEERRTRAAPAPLAYAMAFAAENLEDTLSVQDMARVAGLSRARLTRLFVEHTGVTPWRWVMQVRLERAQALLSQGESVGAVAHATGFADQAHFSRCFRLSIGVPPAQWVRENGSSKGVPILQDG